MYSTPPSSPVRLPSGPTTLNSLKRVLDNTGKPWAFTGSQAMKIHANAAGKTSRLPHNFDVLVNPSNIHDFIFALRNLGYYSESPPPMKKAKKAVRKVTLVKNGNKSIDLLVAGELGPRMNTNTVTTVKGFPVVTIPQLIIRKEIANSNSPNIKFLRSL
jgi:hypothetical protein